MGRYEHSSVTLGDKVYLIGGKLKVPTYAKHLDVLEVEVIQCTLDSETDYRKRLVSEVL